jgi:hypothetical protein
MKSLFCQNLFWIEINLHNNIELIFVHVYEAGLTRGPETVHRHPAFLCQIKAGGAIFKVVRAIYTIVVCICCQAERPRNTESVSYTSKNVSLEHEQKLKGTVPPKMG